MATRARTSCVPDDVGGQNGGSSPRSLRSLGSEWAGGQARVGRKGPASKIQTGSGALGYINLAHTPTPQQLRRHPDGSRRALRGDAPAGATAPSTPPRTYGGGPTLLSRTYMWPGRDRHAGLQALARPPAALVRCQDLPGPTLSRPPRGVQQPDGGAAWWCTVSSPKGLTGRARSGL